MKKYIDITVPITASTPVWPGSPKPCFSRRKDMELGDSVNDTTVNLNVHTATHIDAPLHFIRSGKSVGQIPLETLIGPAFVCDLSEKNAITAKCLEELNLPHAVSRLLIRTENSKLWEKGEKEFHPDYVALTADAAQWVVDRGISLVGIDYLSIQKYNDGPETHLILLEAETVIVEGLNLSDVEPGEYELICLPLKLEDQEGSPARVVLKTLS